MGSLGENQIEGLPEIGKTFTVTKSEPILVRPAAETEDGFCFLSNLDQYMDFVLEMLFCFKADDRKSSEIASDVFINALAKVLVHYYPLAGVLENDSDGRLTVRCTGHGVPFVEAIVNCEIEELGDISMRDPMTLAKFAHIFPEASSTLEMPLLTLQVTRFKCGGLVVGVAFNHCIADGLAITEFVTSWAKIAKGLQSTITPFLDRTILKSKQPPKIEFPHYEYSVIDAEPDAIAHSEEDELLFRSFCFTPKRLAHLKEIAMEDGVVKSCTNFTVLTAFMWRARTKALKMKPGQQTKLLFPVDGRSKFDPPLPKGYFGNAILLMYSLCNAGELMEKPLSFAVKLVQEAIESVADDYIRSSIDYFEVTKPMLTLTPATFLISTWTRLPCDAVDFGAGEPTQIGPVMIPEHLALYLPRGAGGKSTNVLLGLPVHAMKIFQELMETD